MSAEQAAPKRDTLAWVPSSVPLPPNSRVETLRLKLLPPAAADLPDLLEVNGDPEVTRFLPYETWQSLADAKAWLARMETMAASGTGQVLVLERRSDAQVIGNLRPLRVAWCRHFRQDRLSVRQLVHHRASAPDREEPPMAEAKTKFTGASVDAYLASRANPEQLADCKAIMAMCKRVTKQPAKMWGPSIVGYGSYTYRYESGHSGDAPITGFAIRGRELVVYICEENAEQAALLARLGKHRMGKCCLYFKRLADLDASVLEALIFGSVAEVQRRYPDTGAS